MMHMTAYNAYRVQKVLNYDSNSQKGFVTERSKEEYSRCVREMKACMKEIDAQLTLPPGATASAAAKCAVWTSGKSI